MCGWPAHLSLSQQSSLLYNEYIVYDINQIQLRYLVWCDFLPAR